MSENEVEIGQGSSGETIATEQAPKKARATKAAVSESTAPATKAEKPSGACLSRLPNSA